ncbi:MAG TPA: hypothetical protein VJR47_11650 [Stellaceae bacterium]|nr:hypothetical protein [Stellaceae bacterium]
MSGVLKINGVGPITYGTTPQGLSQTLPLLVEVRTGGCIGVLELSPAAARELKEGLASSLRACGLPA